MKCQLLFSGKNKKNISICRLLKKLPSMLNINIGTVSGMSKQCNPDQIPQNVAFDLGLHCAPLTHKFFDISTL